QWMARLTQSSQLPPELQRRALAAIANRCWQKQAPVTKDEILREVTVSISGIASLDVSLAAEALTSEFLRPAGGRSYHFLHPAVEECFLALGAIRLMNEGADPPGWDVRPL